MPEVYVGAGSNADPERSLRFAADELERRFGAIRCSSVYRSAAVGVAAADFLNVVLAWPTELDVDALRAVLRNVEAAAGRTRADPAVCELDLDLLLYGARVDAAQGLPRHGAFAAPFVLGPLAELAPNLRHPVTGERCGDRWSAAERGELQRLGPLRRP